MITIKVTRTPFISEGLPGETGEGWIKTFRTDKEADLYLKQIHDEKMNVACQAAGIGNYALGKITRKSMYDKLAFARDPTGSYAAVTSNIPYLLQIEISH